MRDYVYTPLNQTFNSFRVLAILPAWRRSTRLNCELVEADLDNLDAAVFYFYEALSYTWGDMTNTEDITLDNRRFTITQNLAAALRQLRSYKPKHDGVTFIWIDAVCINQNDIGERNTQVRKMREIYSNAVQVLVWLGPTMNNSDLAMQTIDTITNTSTANDWMARSLQDPSDLQAWQAVARLLSRPYWWRVWIRQEIVLAQEVMVICGDKRIVWSAFSMACELLNQEDDLFREASLTVNVHEANAYQQVIVLEDLQDKYRKDGIIDMEHILLHSKACDCTDPRDKIFSALSLVGIQATGLMPDYELTLRQVAIHAIKTQITNSASLEILTACQDPDRASLLPSWTPDLQQDWHATPIRSREGGRTLYNVAPGMAAVFSFADDYQELVVRGFVCDKVSEVGPEYVLDIEQLYEVLRVWKQVTTRHLPSSSQHDEAFWRTIIADQDFNGNRAGPDIEFNKGTLTDLELSFESKQSIPVLSEDGWYTERKHSLFAGRLDAFAAGRSLFGTAQGTIGMGCKVRQNDLVCVIYGIGVPVILRRKDESYLLVGEAYVHGIMDGEAINESNVMQDFPLI